MFHIASIKIICTDSTEISFSQILLKSFFQTYLPKLSFSLTLTVRGYLISISYRRFSLFDDLSRLQAWLVSQMTFIFVEFGCYVNVTIKK